MDSRHSTFSLIAVIMSLIVAIMMLAHYLSRYDKGSSNIADKITEEEPSDPSSLPSVTLPPQEPNQPPPLMMPPSDDPILRIPSHYPSLVFGFTEPVVGYDIVDTQWGNEYCRAQLSDGYQWTEFHVTGGWVARGMWDEFSSPLPDRAWGWINDQQAECYETGTQGLTGKITHEAPGKILVSWQVGEAQSNPYSGDMPCDERLPLLCHVVSY